MYVFGNSRVLHHKYVNKCQVVSVRITLLAHNSIEIAMKLNWHLECYAMVMWCVDVCVCISKIDYAKFCCDQQVNATLEIINDK